MEQGQDDSVEQQHAIADSDASIEPSIPSYSNSAVPTMSNTPPPHTGTPAPSSSRVETVRKLTPSLTQLAGEFNLPKMLERMSSPALVNDPVSETDLVDGPTFAVDPALNAAPAPLYAPHPEDTATKKKLERKSSILVDGQAGYAGARLVSERSERAALNGNV